VHAAHCLDLSAEDIAVFAAAPAASVAYCASAGLRSGREGICPVVDLRAAGVTAIVWATGYGLDFGWVNLPVFDGSGRPVHRHGVTDVPGFYFLGLPWLSRRASGFVFGAQYDAIRLADHVAAQVERPAG
jgi:hypothetical protein